MPFGARPTRVSPTGSSLPVMQCQGTCQSRHRYQWCLLRTSGTSGVFYAFLAEHLALQRKSGLRRAPVGWLQFALCATPPRALSFAHSWLERIVSKPGCTAPECFNLEDCRAWFTAPCSTSPAHSVSSGHTGLELWPDAAKRSPIVSACRRMLALLLLILHIVKSSSHLCNCSIGTVACMAVTQSLTQDGSQTPRCMSQNSFAQGHC